MRAPSAGWRRTMVQCSSARLGRGQQDLVGERELADVVQQPGRMREVGFVVAEPHRERQLAAVAGDGGGVAGGHAVAQRERLDHRRQHAELHPGQSLGPALRAQELTQQVLERDDDDREQRQRPEPGLDVHVRHAHAEDGADHLGRQDGQEDRPELVGERAAVMEHVVAGDPQEVQEVGDEERGEDQDVEREVGLRDVERVHRPVDEQAADERERGPRGQVGDQSGERVTGADLVDEHRDDADQRRGCRPEQRHREHEREERAGDPLHAVLDREHVARQREREQDEDELGRPPLIGCRVERGDHPCRDEHEDLAGEEALRANRHRPARAYAQSTA